MNSKSCAHVCAAGVIRNGGWGWSAWYRPHEGGDSLDGSGSGLEDSDWRKGEPG